MRSFLACMLALSVSSSAFAQADFLQKAEQTLTQRALEHFPDARLSFIWVRNPPLNKACEEPALTPTPGRVIGRVTVRVQCTGWSFYLQADLDAEVQALVSSQAIPRGARLNQDNLTLAWVPNNGRQSIATTFDQVAGVEASRNIAAGTVITQRHIVRSLAVRKGDRVMIKAKIGRAEIHAIGVAQANGHIGDQIPVKNSNSQKTIYSWVIAAGAVSTRPPEPQMAGLSKPL